MDVTISRLPDTERGAVGPSLSDGLHFHIEARLLGTGDVEGCVTVGFVTLDAGARTALLADVAGEFPASGRDVLNAINRLQKDRVGKADLWDPEGTHYVCPACIVRLFESSSLVGTESTVHSPTGRLQAATT